MITAALLLWIAFAGVNAVSFTLYGVDKHRAKKNLWRISERTLLLATWLMGGVGAVLGMRVFRHKTMHTAFVVSAPLAAMLQLAWMAYVTMKLLLQ